MDACIYYQPYDDDNDDDDDDDDDDYDVACLIDCICLLTTY